MFTFCLLYCDLWMKMKWKNNIRGSYMRKNGMQSCHNLIWFRWLIHAFFGSPCRWNNAQTEHHQEPNFHHYNDDMSTNEDLHHKREQNGDEELTSMLQRYLDNSCSNISGSMGKNKAIETGIIYIDRSRCISKACNQSSHISNIFGPHSKPSICKVCWVSQCLAVCQMNKELWFWHI